MPGGPSDACGFEIRDGDVDVDLTADWVFGERFPLETDSDTGEAYWRCYRRPNGDDDRCLFHMDPEQRRDRWVDDDELAGVLVAVVNDDLEAVLGDDGLLADETPAGCQPLELVDAVPDESRDMRTKRRLQFVGARVGDLNLSYERLAPPSNYNIDLIGMEAGDVTLRHARIETNLGLGRWGTVESLDLSQATNGTIIDARGLEIATDVNASHANLEAVRFDDVEVRGDVTATGLAAGNNVRFDGAEVAGDVALHNADIAGFLHFKDAQLGGSLDLEFLDTSELSLRDAVVGGDVDGDNLRTGRDLFLNETTVHGDASIENADVGATTHLHGLSVDGRNEGADGDLDLSSLAGDQLVGNGVDIAGDLDLGSAAIADVLSVHSAEDAPSTVEGSVSLRSARAESLLVHGLQVDGTMDLTPVEVGWALSLEDIEVGGNVELRHGAIEGELSAAGATVGALDCYQVDVGTGVRATNLTVETGVRFDRGEIGADLTLDGAAVGTNLTLRGAAVADDLSLDRATVEEDTELDDATVGGACSLAAGTFLGGDVSLAGATVDGGVDLRGGVVSGALAVGSGAELESLAVDDGARFGRLVIHDATIRDHLRLGDCCSLPVTGGGVFVAASELRRLTLAPPATDEGTTGGTVLGGPLVVQHTVVAEELAVPAGTDPADPFVHPAVRAVSFAGSELPAATLSLGRPEPPQREAVDGAAAGDVDAGFRGANDDLVYDLSDAVVGEFEAIGSGTTDARPYYQFRFWTTAFDGFRFGEHRAEFAATRWNIHRLRPWGNLDVAAVAGTPGEPPAAPEPDVGLAGAVSPRFVDAHERARRRLRDLSGPEATPSAWALSTLRSTSVSLPTPSTATGPAPGLVARLRRWLPAGSSRDRVGGTRRRTWRTDAEATTAPYGPLERAVLSAPDRDHAGAAVAAVRRLRAHLRSALPDAYREHGLERVDRYPVALEDRAVEALTAATLQACVAVPADGDDPVADVVAAVVEALPERAGWTPLAAAPLRSAADTASLDAAPPNAFFGRLGDTGVIVDDWDTFGETVLVTAGRVDQEPVTDGEEATIRRFHCEVLATALREHPAVSRLLAATDSDDDGVHAAALAGLADDIAADGWSLADLTDADGSLRDLLKRADAEGSLAETLTGWTFPPAARVRNDVWNLATAEAHRAAADAVATREGNGQHWLQQLEGTYTLAKKAAADAGENTAASKLHYRQRVYARKLHERTGRTVAKLKNDGLRLLTGYGEKPLRVVAVSAGVVALWTALFGLVGTTTGALPGAGALELLSLSIGSFATLLPPTPLAGGDGYGVVVRLLTETEALLGVFLVAVFVFTLTRSLQR